jgi:hypothetical protein
MARKARKVRCDKGIARPSPRRKPMKTPEEIVAQDTKNVERQVRQTCHTAAVELAAQLQLVDGLGIAIIEEIKDGQAIEDELAEKFSASLDALKALFERVCPKDSE